METDESLLEKWCVEWDIPYSFASRLKGTVFPLLDGAHSKNEVQFDRIFLEQKEGVDLRHENSKRIMLLLKNKLKPDNFSLEEKTVIGLHFEYMTTVEGFLAPEINFLISLIIANGHNYQVSKGKYAKNMRDIERSNVSRRLKFVGKHGFKEISKKKNEILSIRNSVAHLFYELDKNGNITIGQNKTTEDKYAKLYEYLRNTAVSFHLIRLLYYRRYEAYPHVQLKKVKCVCGYDNLIPEVKIPKSGKRLRCSFCNRILLKK